MQRQSSVNPRTERNFIWYVVRFPQWNVGRTISYGVSAQNYTCTFPPTPGEYNLTVGLSDANTVGIVEVCATSVGFVEVCRVLATNGRVL